MKKKFLAVLCGFIIASGLFASESSFFSFNITPQIGLMNGSIREYVINPNCKNTDNKESELDWDIKNIPVISAAADFWFFRYCYVNLNFRSGVPKASGVMQDYDWLNSLPEETGHYDWVKDDPTELTCYSISENKLDSYYSFGLKMGGSINLPMYTKIIPFISFEYEYIKMSSYGGWHSYKWDNYEIGYFTDNDGNPYKVISYEQEYNSLMFGISLQSEAIPFILIRSEYMISPDLTSLIALDKHVISKKRVGYLDKMPDALIMKGAVEILAKISRNHRIGFSGFLQYIPFTTGSDSYSYLNNKEQPIYDYVEVTGVEGGTDRFLWQVSLVYQFSL